MVTDLFSPLDICYSHLWALLLLGFFILNINIPIIFLPLFLLNLGGLIPLIIGGTLSPILVFMAALPLFLSPLLSSLALNIKSWGSHLLPTGSPLALAPFLVVIELLRVIIRPLTLCIRLLANLLAGHIVLRLLRCRALGSFFWTIFEVFVAFIQSYIFTLLLINYAE